MYVPTNADLKYIVCVLSESSLATLGGTSAKQLDTQLCASVRLNLPVNLITLKGSSFKIVSSI